MQVNRYRGWGGRTDKGAIASEETRSSKKMGSRETETGSMEAGVEVGRGWKPGTNRCWSRGAVGERGGSMDIRPH